MLQYLKRKNYRKLFLIHLKILINSLSSDFKVSGCLGFWHPLSNTGFEVPQKKKNRS